MGNCFAVETRQVTKKPVAECQASTTGIPKNVKNLCQNPGYHNIDIFRYKELKFVTKNFRPDHVLGKGRSGTTFKGVIDENIRPGYENTPVAIEVLNPEVFQPNREWLGEVSYLGQLSHPNLVKLIGYCCESEKLLVYEFLAHGSLENQLFRRVCVNLNWSTRMKIALGAAKGLAFLHGAEKCIIHHDFKTSNILLDSENNAKLSYFGLAMGGTMAFVAARVMDISAYAAPEYVATGPHAQCNVYSFGVVLLEMLIGMRAMDTNRPIKQHHLVDWVRPLLIHNNKKLLRVLDPRMEGQYPVKAAQTVANLACQCLTLKPEERPTMSQVVEILEMLQVQGENWEGASLQIRGGRANQMETTNQMNVGERKTDEILSTRDIESEVTHFPNSCKKVKQGQHSTPVLSCWLEG